MSSEPIEDLHFAPIFRGDTLSLALSRHQHYLFSWLGLKPGMHVLHVGCGHGTPAIELANFAKVFVVGTDDDPVKIQSAKRNATRTQISDRVSFIEVGIKNLGDTFSLQSFDAIFAIESLKVSPSFNSVYASLGCLLKPGGTLAMYEWCWTSNFDQANVEHRRLVEMLEVETFIGRRAPNERTVDCAIEAIRHADLQLLHHEDLASRRVALPWYSCLEGALSNHGTGPRIILGSLANTSDLSNSGAAVICEAGRVNLFTPMAFFVAKRTI
ncbi:Sterol 24-C-methyltransferase [Hypsizygus marmoreus]|uniref:Sterol 24-C-methyltransferase n=1 Tax=Hypsizygus marmoreus TaxID=39966 RepID=A0A369K1S4_HYPMA|nr:Sterol 24-C-methyltransferase [Hypsizygus marmoreus]